MKNNSSLSDKILNQIKSHKVKMRSKSYFISGAILLGVGLTAAIGTAIFFASIIIFRLRVNAPFAYLASGPEGINPFIQNIPWIPIIIALIGIIGGVILMRKFDFSYKHAFGGIIIGFILAIIGFGVFADLAGLPEEAEKIETLRPFIHQKYENGTWAAGTITNFSDEFILLETPDGILLDIMILDSTTFRPDTDLSISEWVRIIGERDEDYFIAEVIFHGESPRRSPGSGGGRMHLLVP